MTVDQGMLFLLITLALVVVVLGGYLFYVSRRGQAARLLLDGHAAGKPADTADVNAGVNVEEEVQIK